MLQKTMPTASIAIRSLWTQRW